MGECQISEQTRAPYEYNLQEIVVISKLYILSDIVCIRWSVFAFLFVIVLDKGLSIGRCSLTTAERRPHEYSRKYKHLWSADTGIS